MRKIIFALLLIPLLLTGGFRVRAQESIRAEIIKVDVGSFPTITSFLDVYSENGKFLSALNAENITALEDGQAIPVTTLKEETIGAQIVVAINPAPPMDTRDSLGTSRYDYAVDKLRIWAEALPIDPQDEISLVTTAGPLLVSSTPNEWRNSLVSFQPDARAAVPSLQSLSLALDLLEGQQDTQEGKKRSILFLTSHLPDQSTIDELEQLTERAKLLNTRINVWMLDSTEYFAHISANALKSMALQSGGEYFAFSGIESLPDPEIYFSHLRHLYIFTYQSRLIVGGNHNLVVNIQNGEEQLTSESQNFALDIQPPNPMLLAPPAQIVRQAPEDDPYNTDLLLPTQEKIDFLVEFPDGHQRPIVRAALLVDEETVAEITTPPFDSFKWDISQYAESGEHSLQIEVEDSLGLKKTSLGVPLTLTIVQPPTGLLAFFGRNGSLLTIGVVAFAGLFLVAILLIGGGRGLQRFAERRRAKEASHDPLTQPVLVAQKKDESKKSLGAFKGWVRRPRLLRTIAYLTRLKANGEPSSSKPIPLTGEAMSFGADPVKVAFVLDDPSISPSHVKISLNEDGDFIVYDQNSIAGTWVNFERINQDGRVLVHGDLIHIGLLRYRFEVSKSSFSREPVIRAEEES